MKEQILGVRPALQDALDGGSVLSHSKTQVRSSPTCLSGTCIHESRLAPVARDFRSPAPDTWPRFRNSRLLFSLCAIFIVIGCWWAPAQDEMPRNETRFTMGRIRFAVPLFNWGPLGDHGPPWSHDWPRSEQNLMKIMAELTKLDVNPGGHIISFDNKEVFKYPIAYFCEVGFLDLSDEEARNMAEYLLRGGFLIVDDFRGERSLDNFRRNMRKVFPDRSLEEVPRTHPIWTCFYDISKIFPPPPYARYLTPQYLGISDDKGRLMMVVDYNNDISDYWEWSGNPFMPIDETNEAFKYGVNYVMYALTH